MCLLGVLLLRLLLPALLLLLLLLLLLWLLWLVVPLWASAVCLLGVLLLRLVLRLLLLSQLLLLLQLLRLLLLLWTLSDSRLPPRAESLPRSWCTRCTSARGYAEDTFSPGGGLS